MNPDLDWPSFYMNMARVIANKSKDPSTKVGAVIVRPDRTLASMGYNGFPRGVSDDPSRYLDRDFKLAATVHAELNAILNAREPLKDYHMVCTFHPCARCASAIVQSGLRSIAYPNEPLPDRWKADMDIADMILDEGGVIRRPMLCQTVLPV